MRESLSIEWTITCLSIVVQIHITYLKYLSFISYETKLQTNYHQKHLAVRLHRCDCSRNNNNFKTYVNNTGIRSLPFFFSMTCWKFKTLIVSCQLCTANSGRPTFSPKNQKLDLTGVTCPKDRSCSQDHKTGRRWDTKHSLSFSHAGWKSSLKGISKKNKNT